LCYLVGLLWSAVAVALEEPLGVVAPDEAGHGLAELVDGVVQLDPQALVLQRADPAFGAASVSGSPRNVGSSLMSSHASEPVK
jgi:hypothetical protein